MDTIQTTVFAQSLSNFSCKLWKKRWETLLILGQRSTSTFALYVKDIVDRIQTTVMPNHFQTSHVSCGWWEEEQINCGSQGQRSRSTLAFCVYGLVGTIQTAVYVQSLSNFTCKLWMMRRESLLILGHGVIGQGQLCPPPSEGMPSFALPSLYNQTCLYKMFTRVGMSRKPLYRCRPCSLRWRRSG